MSIQRTPREKLERFVKLFLARERGDPDEEVARALGFYGLPKLMYEGLAAEGSPVCSRCGELYPDEGHDCTNPRKKTEERRRPRKPKGTAEDARALPPAANAMDLFAPVIEEQQRARDELPFIKEWLSDDRFVTEGVYPEDSGRYGVLHRREDYEDEDDGTAWARVCEEHGQDPRVEQFREPVNRRIFGGASWHPHDPVWKLIGHYAISSGPLEPLLKLHPDPKDGDIEAILKKRKEILNIVKVFAALVRGNRKADRRGRRRDPVEPEEQKALRDGNRPANQLPPWMRNRGPENLTLPGTPVEDSD